MWARNRMSFVAPALLAVALATAPAHAAPATTASLQEGLAARMAEAARNLEAGGDRRTATRALDAARRLARIQADAADCLGSPAPEGGLDAIRRARHALQNGDPGRAAQILRAASRTDGPSGSAVACRVGDSAVGKQIVNARGERLGRLVALTPRVAVLKTGGMINAFGFLDWGNRRVEVPADRLIEGDQMVALASDVRAGALTATGSP